MEIESNWPVAGRVDLSQTDTPGSREHGVSTLLLADTGLPRGIRISICVWGEEEWPQIQFTLFHLYLDHLSTLLASPSFSDSEMTVSIPTIPLAAQPGIYELSSFSHFPTTLHFIITFPRLESSTMLSPPQPSHGCFHSSEVGGSPPQLSQGLAQRPPLMH